MSPTVPPISVIATSSIVAHALADGALISSVMCGIDLDGAPR
jgi:hypothetical protein